MSFLRGHFNGQGENVTVRVDAKAKAFHERLELDVRINDDLILVAHARSMNLKDQDRREIHNLEFGLAFRGLSLDGKRQDPNDSEISSEDRGERGALSLRANVADRDDPRLVPGELLYQYDPYYFDLRRSPPEYQVLEKLYYPPCSICRRASNDPLCKCASLLPDPRPQSGMY